MHVGLLIKSKAACQPHLGLNKASYGQGFLCPRNSNNKQISRKKSVHGFGYCGLSAGPGEDLVSLRDGVFWEAPTAAPDNGGQCLTAVVVVVIDVQRLFGATRFAERRPNVLL